MWFVKSNLLRTAPAVHYKPRKTFLSTLGQPYRSQCNKLIPLKLKEDPYFNVPEELIVLAGYNFVLPLFLILAHECRFTNFNELRRKWSHRDKKCV